MFGFFSKHQGKLWGDGANAASGTSPNFNLFLRHFTPNLVADASLGQRTWEGGWKELLLV